MRMVDTPAHIFDVYSASLAAAFLLVATAFVAAAASTKHNHTKRHGGIVPRNWFPSVESLVSKSAPKYFRNTPSHNNPKRF